MAVSFITRLLILALGHAYPAYGCYKTLELKNHPQVVEQMRFWCQYWILVAFLRVADCAVSWWLPMYGERYLEMGSVVGTSANGVGTFLGNALVAPFRTLFGVSCEGVCSGTWDVACFLEHLCVSSLARLFMVLVLTYITLFFVYLMCKVGIIQCVVKNACKMAAAACSGCCRELGATSCFLWRKVRDTKRVHRGRRRRQDVEMGVVGSFEEEEESPSDDDHGRRHGRSLSGSAGRWGRAREGSSVRERRKDRLRQSLRLRRLASKKEHGTGRSHRSERHHHRVGLGRIEVPSLSRRVHGSARRR